MFYSHKYNQRRSCRQYQQSTEATGMSSEYDTDSAYTCETIKSGNGNHNIKSKYFNKSSRLPESNNEIGSYKSHNTKCPVYVHNMKMQKQFSQNDANQNPRHHRHETLAYNCSKWDYYDDRTHYMKNKFDKLTLSNEYDQKPHKSDCTKTPCPVHHSCNVQKSTKKRSSPTKHDIKPVAEDVINKLEETYWTKWKPKSKAHDQRIGDGEGKMIRTEEDYNKSICCESEKNLPLRCPDCFKCIPDDKDVKCLHKRAATKESKSSDFVKSELDDDESQMEDHYNIACTTSNANCCECPKSCPGNVEMSSSGQNSQKVPNGTECEVPTCPYVVAEKQKKLDSNFTNTKNTVEHKIDSKVDKCQQPTCPYVVAEKQKKLDTNFTNIKNKVEKEIHSKVDKCQIPTCPYVAASKLKSKKSESDTSGSCNNPSCCNRKTKHRTAVSLEGQDIEEQLKITQYSNKLVPTSVENKGVNAEEVVKKGRGYSTGPTEPATNNATGDSKLPNDAKSTATQNFTAENPSFLVGPEGAEIPVTLKHTDSFILNSIKQNSSEGKPHYKQPTTIKLSNTARVKGHSYPLKPILKKEKPQVQRKTLHSPKKPAGTNAKSLKPTHKKR